MALKVHEENVKEMNIQEPCTEETLLYQPTGTVAFVKRKYIFVYVFKIYIYLQFKKQRYK